MPLFHRRPENHYVSASNKSHFNHLSFQFLNNSTHVKKWDIYLYGPEKNTSSLYGLFFFFWNLPVSPKTKLSYLYGLLSSLLGRSVSCLRRMTKLPFRSSSVSTVSFYRTGKKKHERIRLSGDRTNGGGRRPDLRPGAAAGRSAAGSAAGRPDGPWRAHGRERKRAVACLHATAGQRDCLVWGAAAG